VARWIARRRDHRRILEGAAVASVLSGAPSLATVLAGGSVGSAVEHAIGATRVIGTLAPSGRPGLVRGAAIHAVISVAAAELLGCALPRERSVAWGAVGGLLLGVVNLGVIAPRFYPLIAELELAPQLADNIAFGVVFAAVADR
jgi:hypothetical protein